MLKRKNVYTAVVILMVIFVFIILLLSKLFLNPLNPYEFDEFTIDDKSSDAVSLEDWEKTMMKIRNITQLENMDDTVIRIGNRKITRKEYESVRIRQNDLFSYTVKETVYSIVKDCVIVQEAERLNLVPNQEKIDYYMAGIYDALKSKNETGFEFDNLRIKILEMSEEDYIAEQKRVAYEMFQKESLYNYLGNDDEEFEKYVKKLLRFADIKIYDPEIHKECQK